MSLSGVSLFQKVCMRHLGMFNSLAINLSEMTSGMSTFMFVLLRRILHIYFQVYSDPALLLVLVSIKYCLAFFTRTSFRASLASALDSLVVTIMIIGIRQKSKSVFMNVEL